MAAAAQYVSGAARPLVGRTASAWQAGIEIETGAQARHQWALRTTIGAASRWQPGQPLERVTSPRHRAAIHLRNGRDSRWQDGQPLRPAPLTTRWRETLRNNRPCIAPRWQQGDRVSRAAGIAWQDTLRLRRGVDPRWQDGLRRAVQHSEPSRDGRPVRNGWIARYQEAMRPPAGIWMRPSGPPPFDPCYLPTSALLFAAAWAADANLLFVCDRHGTGTNPPPATIVVTPRRTYIVLNSIEIRRVGSSALLPTETCSLSLDQDSWTWSFSATMDRTALAALHPVVNGEPVELEIRVNDQPLRMQAERIGRDVRFPSRTLRVSGKGKAAVLDAPYAPVRTFGQPAARTAEQLVGDILTFNGVNIGWTADWGLTDWLIPANSWSLQGTHVAAISDIAAAAGGYVQPHDTDAVLRILPRYPQAPWDWASVTPDIELPAGIAELEATEWIAGPGYDRIFVSGMANGQSRNVKRAGTAGLLEAPMVTHALMTHDDAVRQRAIAELAAAEDKVMQTLTLMVLPATGIIKPGQFLRYTDDTGPRLGIVRSTQINWSLPVLTQTIGIESRG